MNLKATAIALATMPLTANAIDVAPFKVGQAVDAEQGRQLQARYDNREQQAWREPLAKTHIDERPDAELIHYGIKLLDHTAVTIGPKVADKSKRLAGNQLNCSNCHLKGDSGLPGTKFKAIPFVNVMNDYPNFRSRSMTVGSIEGRVNGCMTRSMNGKPLAEDSREMKAIVAYFDWLATGSNSHESMQGTGLPKIELPKRKVDLANGEALFKQNCVTCHGPEGLGTVAPEPEKTGPYLFPPLAGNDTFNDGAGMSRTMKATRFIYGNMPLGASVKMPSLTVDQAYDVAGYLESLPRPAKSGREKDFPNPDFRPKDYAVPAYFGGDKPAFERAKYGPYVK